MAIKNITTNYTGRKIDLHIMQGVNAPGSSTINLSFGKISNYCAGVQKLIQRYTIMLLTELGSQEQFPTFGSNLITKLTSTSNNYNRSDLYALFALANLKVCNDIFDYQINNPLPEDEQLSNATLEEIISTTDGGVAMRVKIVTRVVGAVDFLIPLPN